MTWRIKNRILGNLEPLRGDCGNFREVLRSRKPVKKGTSRRGVDNRRLEGKQNLIQNIALDWPCFQGKKRRGNSFHSSLPPRSP